MAKPKLLIVTTVPATLASILRGQPKWLNRHFDVSLASSPGAAAAQVAASEGTVVHSIPMVRGISPLADLVAIFRMARLMRRLRPDIVHSYTPKAGLVAMLAGFLARVPVRIHTFTGLIFPTSTGLKRRVLIAVDRLICRAATHPVPEGQGVKADLVAVGAGAKLVGPIGNGNIAGIDTAHFDPDQSDLAKSAQAFRTQWGIADNSTVFGFVGRLNRDKGLETLVQAFADLSDPDAVLLCVGAVDETAPLDADNKARLDQAEGIVLTGRLSDVRPALACMDALVLPSLREGFPNVLLEAAAMAVPLIATDINGNNEIVVPDENGWLFPVGDHAALGKIMQALIQMPLKDRAKIGAAGRKRVAERYERGAFRQALLTFYTDILDGKTR